MLGELLRKAVRHPLTGDLDLDDPKTTHLRKEIIHSKSFLKAIYNEWYTWFAAELPAVDGSVLELGSGAGYCDQYLPDVISSEIFPCPDADLVADAQCLPVRGASLRAIVFTNVLHHIPDVRQFFAEASRCLRPGGRILMVEPWVTFWSRFVYGRLHHEPFHPESVSWSFPSSGPLSGANIAIPWIVFSRDRTQFEKEYPELQIEQVRPFLPFRYLLSGGVATRSLMPAASYGMFVALERLLEPCMPALGMFALISVTKR